MYVYIGKNIEGGDAMLLNDHAIQLFYWKNSPFQHSTNTGLLMIRKKA